MADGHGSTEELPGQRLERLLKARDAAETPEARDAIQRQIDEAVRVNAPHSLDLSTPRWWALSEDAPTEAVERGLVLHTLLSPCETLPVLGHVREDHLSVPKWRALYVAIRDVWEARKCLPGKAIDTRLLGLALRARGTFNAVGGFSTVSDLAEDWLPTVTVDHYASAVVEQARKRAALELARDLATAAKSAKSADEVDAMLLARVREHMTTTGRTDLRAQTDVAASLLDRVRRARTTGVAPGVAVGLPSLDSVLRGLHRGQLIIVAGRPAMGKTVLAENLAWNVATDTDRPVCFFSAEMPDEEVLNRRIAGLARVDSRDAVNGLLDDEGMAAYEQAAITAARAPVLWEDSNITIEEVAAKARTVRHQHGDLALVVIDYAQLLKRSRSTHDDREHAGHVATSAKQLAKELGAPVVLLSQLSRDLEKREDKRPRMSDLRDSGVLEQAADAIVMLYRAVVYDEQANPRRAELIVPKNRHGACGTAHVLFDGERGLFEEDLDAPPPDPVRIRGPLT